VIKIGRKRNKGGMGVGRERWVWNLETARDLNTLASNKCENFNCLHSNH
jgi:hypothetical protein